MKEKITFPKEIINKETFSLGHPLLGKPSPTPIKILIN
jgi:hypothetical protein